MNPGSHNGLGSLKGGESIATDDLSAQIGLTIEVHHEVRQTQTDE